MANVVNVIANNAGDERVLQKVAAALRSNNSDADMLRDFAKAYDEDQPVGGIQFQPRPGQILVCNFGVGFKKPEMVKVRPVLVVSPRQRVSTGLSVVVPISSRPPAEQKPYHYRLPDGIMPSKKYEESWIKGDLVIAVGHHRLDRLKVGHRKFESPKVPDDVLKEARRCVLHAAGMHSLTIHW